MLQAKNVLFFCLLLLMPLSYANVIQYFFGYNYRNPTDANMVKRNELLVGAPIINTSSVFSGVAQGGVGSAFSSETDGLPYLYGAARLTETIAAGLNVSTPYYTNFQYDKNSIVRYDVTKFITKDQDINPHITYKISDKWAIGAGFVANYVYQEDLDFVLPDLGNMTTNSESWAYGWDVGFSYKINAKNIIKLAYFSDLITDFRGISTTPTLFNGAFRFAKFYLPATTKAEYKRVMNDKWGLGFKFFFTQWSILKTVYLQNVATGATIPLPVEYRDTWTIEAGTNYQINSKWGVLGFTIYDKGAPKLKGRTVAFPSDEAVAFGIGTSYKFSSTSTAQIAYAYAFNNTRVNHPLNVSQAVGRMKFRARVVEISLNYKL